MKVVVTGGAGFIGSHLVEALLDLHAETHIIDNLTSGYRSYVPSEAVLHELDIRSPFARDVIKMVQPDVVFHLAAQADVQRSIIDPIYDASVNISGTLNMLEACRASGTKKIVFASTSAVYGNLQKPLISEQDPIQPISFYGMSKWASEQYIRVFAELYGLSYTILRYGNVYGPRQTAKGEGGVVAAFIERIKKGEHLAIHGDGNQTRDFIFVQDIVQANIASIGLGGGETLQISTGQPTSVNTILRTLEINQGHPIAYIHKPARLGDIKHSCLDNRKAKKLLSWRPLFDISAGLEKTYQQEISSPRVN